MAQLIYTKFIIKYPHWINYNFLAITCQTLTLDGQSKALKMQIFI